MTDEQDVWPAGAPEIGQRAELTREASQVDIELFTAISGIAIHRITMRNSPG